MSGKLISVEQKKICELFSAKDSMFLIPDYQRPYAWTEDECATLWDDIYNFACVDNFNSDDEYFLGPIVTFSNDDKLEVIDGQQRLISILLMLRAFYEDMQNFADSWSREVVRKNIGRCIWRTDEEGNPYITELKIDSQVATDEDREELMLILQSGNVNSQCKSRYAKNYRLFQDKLRDFLADQDKSDVQVQKRYSRLPNRILNNCIILPIQAAGQDAALRIFSTLNDRGKPLSDSDIFKVQLYKAFSAEGQKESFTAQWKELETICERIFSSPKISSPMDELFNRYMHYERARSNLKDYSTQEGLRNFFQKENYRLLKDEHKRVFDNLIALADFWRSVVDQNEDKFSERVLKSLFVLHYAPNAMWTLIVSVYFLHNRKPDGTLEEESFYLFLRRITAFIWAYTIDHSGITHLRSPIYKEMLNIVNDLPITFAGYKFVPQDLRKTMLAYKFSGKTKITRSMLAWWVMNDKNQTLPLLAADFETEHIRKKDSTINPITYELLGNKSLLESKIKSASAGLGFSDKKKYYSGQASSKRAGTIVHELREIAMDNGSFNIKDINQRNKRIIDSFINFLSDNQLTK